MLKSLWVVNAATRPLFSREKDPIPVCQDSWWGSGPVWTGTENLAAAEVGAQDLPARSDSLRLLSRSCRLSLMRRKINIVGSEKVLSTLSETMAILTDFSAIVAF